MGHTHIIHNTTINTILSIIISIIYNHIQMST